METSAGFICIDCADVIRRCQIVIGEIETYRKKEDDKTILDYIKSKNYLSFLPGWKPMTKDSATANLKLSWVFPSIASWGTLGDAEDLLNAAHATKSDDMWIAVGSYILNRKFGEKDE